LKRAHVRWARVARLSLAGILSALLALNFALAWLFLDPLLEPGCPPPEPLGPHEVVRLETADGLVLEAWYYPGDNGRAVLALGGVGGALGDSLPPVEFLLETGYGVLQVGSRACAGGPVTLGGKELLDAQAGLRFLLDRPEVERVALFGFSMGAAAAIRAAALQPQVDAVIAEGGYFNLGQDFVEPGSQRSPLRTVFLYTLALVYRLRTGVDPWQVSPVDDIGHISPRPLLLIYGQGEAESGRAELQYAAAGEPKVLWLVPGGDHGANHLAGGEEYQRRILDFLTQALGE
jgi:dipeptidyl aminopeptidase/acylaminoacyl peptidase